MMNSGIKPILDPLEGVGPIQISVRIGDEPYSEGMFAPHLHIKAYHEKVKTIDISLRPDEVVEMSVPQGFTKRDMLTFIEQNGEEIYGKLQEALDGESDQSAMPLTHNSTVPFLGKSLPIILLDDAKELCRLTDHAVYIKCGLSDKEMRTAVLDMLGENAYTYFKSKLDHYAAAMKVSYSCLEIDDGRRTFGSYNDSTKVVFLSRRLLMMDEPVIDFLIVHELAHAVYLPHGEAHDAVMRGILPNFDELDDAFYDNCNKLLEQGWM